MAYLKRGDRGEAVRALQQALNALNCPCGAADGIWGDRTEAGVRAFETRHNLGISREEYDLALRLAGTEKPGTQHFALAEFEVHDRALEALWEPIPPAYYGNVRAVMEKLEALRDLANRRYAMGGEVKIIIRSGYRPAAYNARVGGAEGSQHVTASAADIYAVRVLGDRQQVRIPNCYQLARLCQELWPWRDDTHPTALGWGLGANTNLHLDVRPRAGHWWYNYGSWAAWEKNQGARA